MKHFSHSHFLRKYTGEMKVSYTCFQLFILIIKDVYLIVKWKWKLLSHARLFATPWTDYTVHEILQARILEWVAFPFTRRPSQPRDQTQVSSIAADSLPAEPQRKPSHCEYKSKLIKIYRILKTYTSS